MLTHQDHLEQELSGVGASLMPLARVSEQQLAQGQAMHFGLALFNLRDTDSGGVSFSPRHGYRRFVSPGDLALDTIWLSDLEQVDLSITNLRSSKYLQVKLTTLAEDLGVELRGYKRVGDIDKGGMVDVAAALCTVRDLLQSCYKWPAPQKRWTDDRMVVSLRRALPRMEPAPQVLETALEGAFQPWSKPLQTPFIAYENGSRTIFFRRNRLQHALDLLSTPMPADGWMAVSSPQVPIKAFLGTSRPCLLQVAIEWRNATPEQISLIAFGSGVSRGAVRRWITQVELCWLVQYATVTIEQAFVANAAAPLPPGLQLPPMLTADPLFGLSVPVGVVAEMHWVALTQREVPRTRMGDRGRLGARTQEGVWLRAMDRAISFQMAVTAQQMGLQVTGYGSGGVVVRVEHQPVERLLEMADALDACHPCLSAEVVGRERGN